MPDAYVCYRLQHLHHKFSMHAPIYAYSLQAFCRESLQPSLYWHQNLDCLYTFLESDLANMLLKLLALQEFHMRPVGW